MIDVLDGKVLYRKIDELRKKRGWTVYELAKQSGVASTTIYNWRDRNSSPTLALLDALCATLGITLLEFLTDEDDMIVVDHELRPFVEAWKQLSAKQREYLLGLMNSIKS